MVWFGFGIDEAIRPSVRLSFSFFFLFFPFLRVEVGERFVERGRRSCRRGFLAKVIFQALCTTRGSFLVLIGISSRSRWGLAGLEEKRIRG